MITWTPERWRRASALFDKALQLPRADRTPFLASSCEDDALRQEVEAMVALASQDHSLLDGEAADAAAPLVAECEAPDLDVASAIGESAVGETTVGRYRLLQPLGRGGMGAVYLAERADGQYHQQVALKLLTRASPDAARRFQAERQILAALDHPSIARLLDGGTAPPTPSQPDGVPYLVMEYVDGEPITAYCQRKALSIDARLALLGDVADAVQHAHRKLVIHRDLKPSNIYVTEDDAGRPQVKLLDFGIAKMLDRDVLPSAFDGLSTQTGRAVLTPAYAAPEQVAGQPCDVTTDVYQLGVVLYELLTGHVPFRQEGISSSDLSRAILEDTPTRPSAAARAHRPPAVAQSGRVTWDDLDTIVLKALRKAPDQRYASVAALGEDLARYRSERPVRARSATLTYQVQKFVRRHRLGVGLSAVFAGLVFGLLFLLAYQWNEARTEAEKAKRVSGYLTELFQASRPDVAQGQTVTADMLLDWGQRRLGTLDGEPAVQAQMIQVIGQARLGLGHLTQADSLLTLAAARHQRAYGSQDARTLLVQTERANTWLHQGRYTAADSLLQRILVAARRAGNEERVAIVLNDLGNTAEQRSAYATAEAYHREALALRRRLFGEVSEGVAASLNNVGRALHSQDALDEAEAYYREAMALNARVHGRMHPETSITLRNLADLFQMQERYAAADSLLHEVLRIDRAIMPADHPRLAEDLNELGALAARRGRYVAAEGHFRRALQIQRRRLGAHHPRIALSYNNLAYVLEQMGQADSVLAMRRRAIDVAHRSLGPNHVNSAVYVHNLGKSLRAAGRVAEAEQHFRKALATMRARLPETHRLLSHPLTALGRLCLDTDRPGDAEVFLRESLRVTRAAWAPDHPESAEVASLLGHSLARQGAFEEADALLAQSYARLAETRGEAHASTQAARRYLDALRKQPSFDARAHSPER
jgi:serine/threonine-protein kinase